MNQFRKCERTTSRECGSTRPSARPSANVPCALWNGSQIGAPAGRRQHLERLWLLIAIGKRGDGIVIQSVLPIALDFPNTDLASPPADLPPQTARGATAVPFRRRARFPI